MVELVDLAVFGHPVRLAWRKHRFWCPDPECGHGSWTVEDPRIGARRLSMTDRAGRWVTFQVGRLGRTVAEVARELGCDWHTINDTVIAYGEALIDDDPGRIGEVTALGLDETLFCRSGRWRTQLRQRRLSTSPPQAVPVSTLSPAVTLPDRPGG